MGNITKRTPMSDPAPGLYLATMLAASSLAAAETPLTIDQLLAQGWEIAGYASGYDNRTSLILFRHPGVNVLVQCGILFDVTRTPRTVVNCYELPEVALSDRDVPRLQTANDAIAASGRFRRYGPVRLDVCLQKMWGDHHPHNQN